jgi:hypothetical protein
VKFIEESPKLELNDTVMTDDLDFPKTSTKEHAKQPHTPYRPKDNNIFGTQDSTNRFQTTYMQFSANRPQHRPMLDEPLTAGIRSDHKERKKELQEWPVEDKRAVKLQMMQQKFALERARLIRLLQSSSTGVV